MSDPDELHTSNALVESELRKRLERLESSVDRDVIVCVHLIQAPFDDIIRDQLEAVPNKRKRLLVVLETDGGSIETAERIVDVLRHHYPDDVSFLVPGHAMSAGTILVMSGDAIYMDYYSVLGPIDPQIKNASGRWVPALGYLEKYEEFVAKSNQGTLSPAEIAFFVQKFDPAELYRFEQARDHSIDLLKRWLVAYKFKDWTQRSTTGQAVTPELRQTRAQEIATALNDTKKWRSHGRGLSINVIRQELNLQIEDFGTDPHHSALKSNIRPYFRLLKGYMEQRTLAFAVQTRESLFIA